MLGVDQGSLERAQGRDAGADRSGSDGLGAPGDVETTVSAWRAPVSARSVDFSCIKDSADLIL